MCEERSKVILDGKTGDKPSGGARSACPSIHQGGNLLLI